MKKLLLLLILFSFLSCKKTTKEEIKAESNYSISLRYISSYPEYSLFTKALERIDLESELLGISFSILVPNDKQFEEFIHNKGFDNIEDIPQNILEKMVLNHIADSKIQLSSSQSIHLKSIAKVPASNGKYHQLSLLFEKDQYNNFTINGSHLIKELIEGNRFNVFSIENPIELLKLEDIVKRRRFYNDVIRDNSSYNLINKLNNSEQKTVLFLSDNKIDEFLNIINNQNNSISLNNLSEYIYIPDFNIHRHDFFSPKATDPSIKHLAISLNTLSDNKITIESFTLQQPQIGRNLKLNLHQRLPLEFFSNYEGTSINYDGKISYSIEKDIYITDNGILLLFNDFIITDR